MKPTLIIAHFAHRSQRSILRILSLCGTIPEGLSLLSSEQNEQKPIGGVTGHCSKGAA
ncbi:MAG: hypothetical protein AAF663_00400 [Planctomycetota bacterium]